MTSSSQTRHESLFLSSPFRNTQNSRRRDRDHTEFESDYDQIELPPRTHLSRLQRSPPPAGIHKNTLRRSPRKLKEPALPKTNAFWYKEKRFKMEWATHEYKQINIVCLQPNCFWSQKTQNNKVGGSGNMIAHYHSKHSGIPITEAEVYTKAKKIKLTKAEAQTALFQTRTSRTNDHTLRSLLLSFFVSNNLSFRTIESDSFKALIEYFSETSKLPSRRELVRDLETMFTKAQALLRETIKQHTKVGGRVSLTTDTWSAKNGKEFMAVTVHWIDLETFTNTSRILDVIELKEPNHTGKYMSQELHKITEFYGITMSVFTISRDNASPNNCLVVAFEDRVQEQYEALGELEQAQYHLLFKLSNGDIRCFAHIINIGVQAG